MSEPARSGSTNGQTDGQTDGQTGLVRRLGLFDLAMAQVLLVVGTNWFGVAARLGGAGLLAPDHRFAVALHPPVHHQALAFPTMRVRAPLAGEVWGLGGAGKDGKDTKDGRDKNWTSLHGKPPRMIA